MTRRAAALLAALNRHRKPDLPRRKAAASARIPAAPDNQPGTDPASLWTCRRAWTASQKEGQ